MSSVLVRDQPCVASDGMFLYVTTRTAPGITKVGTGRKGSLAGIVYGSSNGA